MEDLNNTVADWLRDAHAMEQQAEKLLTSFSDRLESYPEFKSQLIAHIDVTRQNQQMLHNAIEMAGESTSTFKDLGARLMAMSQTASGMAASDEAVKKAAQSMRENQVYRLVVLDDRDNMRIRGIVSLNDIVDHDKEQLGGETARGISS